MILDEHPFPCQSCPKSETCHLDVDFTSKRYCKSVVYWMMMYWAPLCSEIRNLDEENQRKYARASIRRSTKPNSNLKEKVKHAQDCNLTRLCKVQEKGVLYFGEIMPVP